MRVLKFTLNFLSEAEMYGNAFVMARTNGIVRDVLAINDLTTAYLSEQCVFGLAASEELVNEKLEIYRQNFNIKERL